MVIINTHVDRLQNDSSSTIILILHHLLCMFSFLLWAVAEESVEATQCDIGTVKIPSLWTTSLLLFVKYLYIYIYILYLCSGRYRILTTGGCGSSFCLPPSPLPCSHFFFSSFLHLPFVLPFPFPSSNPARGTSKWFHTLGHNVLRYGE